MAKKTALAKVVKAELIPAFFEVERDSKGRITKFIGFKDDFKKNIVSAASDVGGFLLQTVEQKMQLAMNLASAFAAWKEATPAGGFHTFSRLLDPTIPEKFGQPGTPERQAINSHKIYNGLDYLWKKGKKANQAMIDRQNLIKAGHNPDDAAFMAAHRQTERTDTAKAFQKGFDRCMVQFDKIGVTETTIANMLVLIGKRKKDKNEPGGYELSTAGGKIRDAAFKEVLKARGLAIKEAASAVATKTNIMETLKEETGKKTSKKAS